MVRDEIQIQAEKDYAVDKALREGRQESLKSVQSKMSELGISPDIIKQVTGLDME